VGANEASLYRITLIVVLVCAACSEGSLKVSSAQLPALPGEALPELRSQTSTIGFQAVTAEALDPADLEGVLQDAGFLSGRERRFSGRTSGFTNVVTRVLAFETPDGATAYVDWVRSHPDNLIGKFTAEEPLDLPGSPFLAVHAPDPCCPKDLPIYLSAWRRDTFVLFVRASGPGAGRRNVTQLAEKMDGIV
jgi:hypothetical protein